MILLHLHDRIIEQWQKLPPNWRIELTSAFYTFATATVLEAGVQYHLNGNAFPSEIGVALAIFATCVRAGVKALGRIVYAKVCAWLISKRKEQRYE